MKSLKRLFRGISNLKGLKIMAKKMGSLVRKILSEVGRNEMLSWGYRIEKWEQVH